MADDEKADPFEVLSDLQIEVGALRHISELLLAQHFLNSGAPHMVLEQLKDTLSTASTVVAKSLSSPHDRDYINRLDTETKSIIEQAAFLMRAMVDETSQWKDARFTSGNPPEEEF
jgi:hypothetical protein